MRQLVRLYYLATPAFFLVDWLADLNVRVAFLDQFTAGRYAYYGVCFALGVAAWRRPQIAGLAGFVESSANVALLIISVFVWYWGALETLGSEGGGVPVIEPAAVTNFVLSAVMAGVSYTVQRVQVAR